MNDSNYFGNRHDDRLGVNRIGKNIRKSPPPPPPHQPNFANPARQPPPPQVYNINKNDFQSIVQQLTGSPLHHSQEPLSRPNPPNNRLHKIRPPSLAPIHVNRPQIPPRGSIPNNNNNNLGQPPRQPMVASGVDHIWRANTAESPISAYMRYLQHSIVDPTQNNPQIQSQSSGFRPSPRMNGLPSPLPPFPSPRIRNTFIPPSPNSQFVFPSPSGYMNLLSPLSSYPLMSPGYQHPMSPIFSFSPIAQSGILGPPPSPGMGFPSPGFFQLPSPRWKMQKD